MPSRFESPISRLDLLIAQPLLMTTRNSPEVRLSSARLAAPSPRATGSRELCVHCAPARLRSACTALRRDFMSFLAPGLARCDDEFKSVLMFSLIGLALSLFLAAQARATGVGDILTGILMLSS